MYYDNLATRNLAARIVSRVRSPAGDEYVGEAVIDANDAVRESVGRTHPGSIALLKAAKLVCGREHLCLIRNISPAGLEATALPVPLGAPLVVLLTEDLPLAGTVVWVDGETMGVRFDEEIDVAAVLAELVPPPGERRARLPRFDIDAWARLRVGARLFSVRVWNISQGGARVHVQGLSAPGDAVLSMEGFRSVEGVIRWCEGSRAGMSFNQSLGLRELMHWLPSIKPASIDRSIRQDCPERRQGAADVMTGCLDGVA